MLFYLSFWKKRSDNKDLSKTGNSRGVNALIVKNCGTKLHKTSFLALFYLLFPKSGGESLPHPSPRRPLVPSVSMDAMETKTEKTEKHFILSLLKFNCF